MKKGSQIQLIGRLVQERWQQEDVNRSRVVIVAESVSYVGSAAPKTAEKSDSSAESKFIPDSF
jgi:single-stranded DNA-binding protein